MKQKDHKALAHYLLDRSNEARVWKSATNRRLFFFGCIFPDLFFPTYLRGFPKSRAMLGHHARYSQRKIEKTEHRLRFHGVRSFWDCFRLGTLMHYLSDSFTYSHTDGFEGSMGDHRRYERAFHPHFSRRLSAERDTVLDDYEPLGDGWLSHCRRDYEQGVCGFDRDCDYILRLCGTLFLELCHT